MKTLRTLSLNTLTLLLAATAAPADGDAENGKKLFARCTACHSTTDQNKTGPGLAGVVGRKAGTATDFPYSPAMSEAEVVWDKATLSAFLENPGAVVPQNRMTGVRLRDAQDRDDIAAYLATLTH